MAFNVRIRFTGICALVRQPDNSRAAVVLPNAWNESEVLPPQDGPTIIDIDEVPLRRHRAILHFPVHRLLDHTLAPSSLEGLLYLNGEDLPGADVTFEVAGGVDELIVPDQLPDLASLETIAPEYSAVDPKLLRPLADLPSADRQRLAGRALLHRGQLYTASPLLRWVFPGTLNDGNFISQALAHEIIIYHHNITSFFVNIQHFDGETITLPFDADDDQTIDIRISHMCDRNPLRWRTTVQSAELPPDEDFRWYFQLLTEEQRFELQEKLRSALPLPLPHIVRSLPNGQGVDCFPADTKPQPVP